MELARCRDRLCPLCSIQRGRELRCRVLSGIERWDAIRFTTLTLKASAATLEAQFERANAAFTKLRKSDVWTDNVKEAIATTEITIGREGQWHLHLHVLHSGGFVPHEQLKAAWYDATGDSYIVHIEAVHARSAAAKYVAAYVAGGDQISRWPADRIREYSQATHGKRLVRCYGGAKLPALDEDSEPDTIGPSKFLVDAGHMTRAAQSGCDGIRHACDILARLGNAHAAVLDRDPPDRTLPPPEAWEIAFAVATASHVAKMFPLIPDAATIESERRFAAGEPHEPAPSRLCQAAQDPLWRPSYT